MTDFLPYPEGYVPPAPKPATRALFEALLGIPSRVGNAFTGMARQGLAANEQFMSGEGTEKPFLPSMDSGGRIGELASFLSSNMAMGGPAGSLGAGPSMARKAAALPMDEASRMARAAETGHTIPVYHASRATEPFDAFRPQGGPQRHDLHGVHVGTLEAADARAKKYFGGPDYGVKSGVANESQAASIMPLMMRAEKPYKKRGGAPYSEAEIRRQVTQFAEKNGIRPDSVDAKIKFRQNLVAQGYDVIPYLNSVEDRGNVSYLVLKPENLRSRFAAFDPAKRNSADLLAGYANPSPAFLYGEPQE